jgi:hypothetical protein
MLVCAFAGKDPVLAAYEHAVRERYRFFSYGDAMFLTKARVDGKPRVDSKARVDGTANVDSKARADG